MTKDEIRVAVYKVLRLLLKKPEAELADDMSPINDLGLDSKTGLLFATLIAAELGIEIPLDVNPFLDDDDKPVSIKRILALLIGLHSTEAVP